MAYRLKIRRVNHVTFPAVCDQTENKEGLRELCVPRYHLYRLVPLLHGHGTDGKEGRGRRKKCDERKPTCAACERLGFKCDWPVLSSLEDRRVRGGPNSRWSSTSNSLISSRRLSEKMPPTAVEFRAPRAIDSELPEDITLAAPITLPASYHGNLVLADIFLRTNRECTLLKYYLESFLPANILPGAHANFSLICLDIWDIPELLDSILACTSIHLANKDKTSPVEALNYYTRAISGVRKRLDAGEVTGLEDWMSIVTILLHCFEVSDFQGLL